jgi:hypothetical protein
VPGPRRIDLGALLARRALTGDALPEAAVRWIGHRVAACLADAHDAVDEAGDPATLVHGRLRPENVRLDEAGEVAVVEPDTLDDAPQIDDGKLTPRTDVYALGVMVGPLATHVDDAELADALRTAVDPDVRRRRITCVELDALFARGVDPATGRAALAACVRECLAAADAARARAARPPLSMPARLGVAVVTASVVFGVGVWVERFVR